MDNNFYKLNVEKVVKETYDAKSIYFDIPTELKEKFLFAPGQYLTLKFKVNGEELRRAYSICTSPLNDEMAVTVKRVDGGRVSNHINSNLHSGDTVEVMPPQGKFTIPIQSKNSNDYYFFAGGSGVTPMISIIKTVLEKEPNSTCSFLYGCRDGDNIIFEDGFDELLKNNPKRLKLRYILSNPIVEKASGLSGLFGKTKATWKGWSGFMTEEKIEEFLGEGFSRGGTKKYMICGPTVMMDLVKNSLQSLNIPDSEVMIEYFSSPKTEKAIIVKAFDGPSQVKVTLKGKDYKFEINDDTNVLDAVMANGGEAPYSCTSGACSTCMAKLTKGTVVMDSCFALDDNEINDGFVLTCQAHPTSEEIELSYDFKK